MTTRGRPVDIELRGIQPAMNALSRLDQKARRRVATKAVRAGGKEQRKAARSYCPVDSGQLKKQLRTSVKRDRARGTVTMTVKVKRTKSQHRKGVKNRAQVIHLIVEGTAPHTIPGPLKVGNSGRVVSEVEHPGITTGNPFMERAARHSYNDAVKTFRKRFGREIETEAIRGTA